MGIQGAVLVTPTVSAHTLTAETATMPQSNMTIVKIWHGAVYVSIPIDATRSAIFPSAGGVPGGSSTVASISTGRPVTIPINGNVLNYSVYSVTTTPNIVFYYGTPLKNATPLTAWAAVATAVTLSSGSGSGTWTFPSGNLKLTAVTASVGIAAASTGIQLAFNTSAGQSFNAFIYQGVGTQDSTKEDLLETDLPVAQTVTVTLSGGSTTDIVVMYAYYM